MVLALLLALLPAQDDFTKWIAQLESDVLVERDEAMRRLHALGMPAVPRLEKARDAANTPELRTRLDTLLVSIRRSAELATVMGPTRRVTIASRGRPFKEILAELRSPGVAEIRAEGIDEESRLDLQVRDATWWEAMDRVARAAGARYEIEALDDGQVRVVFSPGKDREGPVAYESQFRISSPEAARTEVRWAGETRRMAMVFVEIRYQADLKPHERWFGSDVKFESVLDAKGADVKEDEPKYAPKPSLSSRALGSRAPLWIRPDAVLPLTIAGKAGITFPSRIRDVTLDFAGEGSRTRIGPVVVSVAEALWMKDSSRVRIHAVAKEVPELEERLTDAGAFVLDAKGRKHPGKVRSRRYDEDSREWELEFTSGIENPRKISFRWVEEFHQLEIPFRLEGVRLPELK
ncbi:MAG TPA: hypothetical protein VJU16_01910 [Planctomycetota bacterium]|nr:hypothetical protein [Planctomycetota bacterium]